MKCNSYTCVFVFSFAQECTAFKAMFIRSIITPLSASKLAKSKTRALLTVEMNTLLEVLKDTKQTLTLSDSLNRHFAYVTNKENIF